MFTAISISYSAGARCFVARFLFFLQFSSLFLYIKAIIWLSFAQKKRWMYKDSLEHLSRELLLQYRINQMFTHIHSISQALQNNKFTSNQRSGKWFYPKRLLAQSLIQRLWTEALEFRHVNRIQNNWRPIGKTDQQSVRANIYREFCCSFPWHWPYTQYL